MIAVEIHFAARNGRYNSARLADKLRCRIGLTLATGQTISKASYMIVSLLDTSTPDRQFAFEEAHLPAVIAGKCIFGVALCQSMVRPAHV